ncbi:MAG: hypothetical protein HQL30_09460 [Candidatus Omnitrophica bacterium]|nr:hypothetical protein [Candidatus Omnitrophota bacterium]
MVFTEQQIGWTENGKPVWTVAKSDEMVIKQEVNAEKNIEIPYDLANTQEAKINGKSDQVVINIQDAHSSLAAQYSIAGLLDSLVTNYDLSLIAIEGSTGHIDTSILKTIPDEEIRKDTAAFFMAEGKISAGTFFQATSDKDIALYGIENDDLYKKNVESFKALAEARAVQSANLQALLEQLSAIEEKCLSSDLTKINKLAAAHRSGEKSFKDYWKEVSVIAEANKIDISGKKELMKLVSSMQFEEKIDFTKANDERKQLIDRLSGILEKAELEKMVLKSVAFKQNKISQASYHKYLTDLAQKTGVAGEEYPNLTMFTEYVTVYESVDILGLYREVEGIETELRTKLYRNDWEKELNYTTRMARLLKQLYEMELSNGEYAFLEGEKGKISAEKWSGFIKDACLKNNVEITGQYDLGGIFGGVEEAMGFYRDAEARNGALLANTLERMKSEGKNVAALITGGYHTEGLTGLMKNKGLSYLIVVPKFDGAKERPYIAVLTGKKSQYEKILETGKYELAVSDMFDSFTNDFLMADRAAALNIIKPVVFYQLGQVALGDNDPAEFKTAYKTKYRKYFDLKAQTPDRPVLTPDEFASFIDQVEVRRIATTAVIFDGSETNVPFVTMVRKGVETGGAVKYEFRVTSAAERRAFVARMEALRGERPGAVTPEDFAEALKTLESEVKAVQDVKTELKEITAKLGTSINNLNGEEDVLFLLPEKETYINQVAKKLLNENKYASPDNIRRFLKDIRGIDIPETIKEKEIYDRVNAFYEKVRERQFELIISNGAYQKAALIKSAEMIGKILGAEIAVNGAQETMKLEDVIGSLILPSAMKKAAVSFLISSSGMVLRMDVSICPVEPS